MKKNKSMKSDDFSRFFIIFQVFSPVYKIEGHDSEDLEPLGSIKLKCIRQDGQEQLEYSGQLSIKKSWGAWFYRKPTNPPTIYKSDLAASIL